MKKSKNTKKILFITCLLAIFSGIGLIYAQGGDLEVDYPTIGRIQGLQDTGVKLTVYIRYIYNFAIISGGLIALLSLIYGGFRFLTSAGNPGAMTDARGQILAGFLGLVVILGSYIVLNELNPDLISLRVPGITATRKGIILYSQPDCGGLTDQDAAMPDVAEILDGLLYTAMNSSGPAILGKDSADKDILPASLFSFEDEKNLIIQLYANEACDENISPGVKLSADTCININASNVKCIKFIWYIPGVWVFNELHNGNVPDPGDLPLGWEEGVHYIVLQSNQDSLPRNFHDKVLGIAIVPEKTDEQQGLGQNYGVIAHNIPGGMLKEKGWAHIYLPKDEITRYKIADNSSDELSHISSFTIFKLPRSGSASKAIRVCRNDRCEPQRVGDDFFDVVNEYEPGSELAEITGTFGGAVSPHNLGSGIVYGINLQNEKWTGTNNAIVLGRNQADGVSAIEIEEGDNYLVLLYDENFNPASASNVNDNTTADAAIINISMPSLRTIQMDGRVGTIIVIRTSMAD